MSWLFSQALVAEYWQASCSDGEPCAVLNVMLTPQQFWRNDKMMDCSKPSLFGLTLRHLTADRGEELLTSFLGASRAKILASPEKARVSTANGVDCGKTLPALLTKYCRDTYSSKTAQCLEQEDSKQSSVTLPRSGMMRNGRVYPLPNVVRHISATGFGWWPTPTTRDYKGMSGAGRQQRKGNPKDTLPNAVGGVPNPEFSEWLMCWPIGWTSIEPMNRDGWAIWYESMAAHICSDGVCEQWFNKDHIPKIAVGVKNCADRLKCIGNGQVPRVAVKAFQKLTG